MPIIEHMRDGSNTTMWCPIVELRQYALHPGRREDLIQLFDSEFIESQEAVGLTVMGQFRDLDDPNAFVWLRGFASMDTRAEGLASFYDGPIWRAYRDRANATMIGSDNVLLLRPARPGSGFAEIARPAETTLDRDRRAGLLAATIYYLAQPADVAFLEFFERQLAPALRKAGASIDACYTTEPSPTRHQRCWNHRVLNVLDKVPKRLWPDIRLAWRPLNGGLTIMRLLLGGARFVDGVYVPAQEVSAA